MTAMGRIRTFIASLRGRLILGVALVNTVLMMLFIADLTWRQRAMLLDRQVEEAETLAQSFATSAAGWIAASDIAGLQEIIETQRRHPELEFAMIADKQGLLLAHTDPTRHGQYLLDLPQEAKQTLISKTPAMVDIAAPAILAGRHVGWARVGIGQKVYAEKLAKITRNGVLYALTAIFIVSAIVWLMGWQLTRRLYSVQETIAAVRAGNRQSRSQLTGNDEAAEMAKEFNAMLDALAERDLKLLASEEKYRRTIDTAVEGIWILGADGITGFVNARMMERLGYAAEEITGRPITDFLFEEDKTDHLEKMLTSHQGKPVHYTRRFRHKQGQTVWTFASASPIFDNEQRFQGLFMMFTDITDLKEAENKINELNQDLERRVVERTAELEAVIKELEGFSYTISHDLRAPLRAIDGFSRILLDEYRETLDDEGKRLLNVVRDNTVRMGQLIEDILAFTRIGRLEIALSKIDMAKLALDAFEAIKPADADAKLHLEIEAMPIVSGDRTMMHRVLTNLLSNAIKFSLCKDAVHIIIGGYLEGNEAVYYVKDNGVGFDMRYAHKLFGVSQRLHGVDEFKGSGIGLAIVKRIVTRHGGRVWAEGKVNEGATIYFTLPAREIGDE